MSSPQKPVLWIFGGPNGSGKSFVTNSIYMSNPDIPQKYINADVIAKERNISSLEAANIALAQREAALAARGSFAMETVMSMPDKIDLMRRAKSLGYEVMLVYVSTQDPDINLGRVKRRRQAGGHDVPPEKVLSRYDRSMRFLPEALAVADKADIYNNSFDNPVLIAEKTHKNGLIIYEQSPPSKWTRESIMALIGVADEKEQRICKGESTGETGQQQRYYEPEDREWEHSDDRDDR
ncbi:MAG TPA: zeta toxin family protein [Spirochaetia bacterium]|nr:zeta toxin family protein [Spirochaetia bacterium]